MSRRWAPGVPDLVFGLVLVSVLIGGRFRLLNDPGTLWHLRLGQDILRTGRVPRIDTLTYSKAGADWVDQSWMFDAGLAFMVEHAGWSAAALLSALGIATVYGALARGLIRDGRAPLVVLAVALVAAGVGSIHFLIRPHLLTLAFVLLTLRFCQRQHEGGRGHVFLVAPLTALWANLHGGFLAGPVIVFTAALGHAVAREWNQARRREVATFFTAGIVTVSAALLNPYGLGLYQHVGQLLVSSGVTELIEEYQPVPFGKPDARAFELVLLALVALPTVSASRVARYELSHVLVWLHLSLASVRHAPLAALAIAPALARLLDGIPLKKFEAADAKDLAAWSFWPPLTAAGLALAVATGVTLGGFDGHHWPLDAIPVLNAMPAETRLFHEQDWGGLIAAETNPSRPTFLDDRFELFGKRGILRYLNAIEGGPDWDDLRDSESIGLVWLRPERGLARRLASDPVWQVRHRDSVSVLFQRVERQPSRRAVATVHGFEGR
jgi:hypothetical protein